MDLRQSEGRSWVAGPARVKHRAGPNRSEWKRHLEGWQVGVFLVASGLLAAAFAAPRPVEPDAIPLPEVDRLSQRRENEVVDDYAAQARARGLPYDVRAVGEMIRRFGRAAVEGNGTSGSRALATLRNLAPAAAKKHTEEMLMLRAFQTHSFLNGLEQLQLEGTANDDLLELGGRFLAKARSSGWIDPQHQLTLSRADVTVLFKIRWCELTGLSKETPLAPSLDDWRAYYRILLQHPADAAGSPDTKRLAYVEALEKYDSDYLGALARGVLYYRLGAHRRAAEAFQAHLNFHPNGAWTLRAQNYLAAANSKLAATETR